MNLFQVTPKGRGGIGKKVAKMWNRDVVDARFRCDVCWVTCGNDEELGNHYRKRHKHYYEEMRKREAA